MTPSVFKFWGCLLVLLSRAHSCTAADPTCHDDGSEALSMLQKRAHSVIVKSSSPSSGRSSEVALLDEDEAGPKMSLADVCVDEASPGGNPNWYMKVVSMKNNNLGGLGPDKSAKKEMRMRVEIGSGKGNKQRYDLVIQNTTTYYPKDSSKNGLIDGVRDFFRINTRGKSTTRFKARFLDTVTGKPVKMDRLFFTWYDIDKTRTSLHEKLLVKDFARYTLTESTKLQSSTKTAGAGWRMFNAGKNFKGTGVDFNPNALGKKQFDVSVLLQYAKFKKFEFKLKTTGSKTVGRNYMFSGTSKLFRECNAFDCDLWGDPHISGFDQQGLALQELPAEAHPFKIRSFDRATSQIVPVGTTQMSALEFRSGMVAPGDLREGDMWLVKSEDVYVQGRFGLANGGKNSFLKAVAIGGPFLKGNSLVLGTNTGISLWNNRPILEKMNTTFTTEVDGETVFARFHEAAQHIDIPDRTTAGVDVSLPSGVQLVLNRFNTWLGLRVHMAPREGGQDGECGNFNGNPHDDGLSSLQHRMHVRVQDDESVFHMTFNTWKSVHEGSKRDSFIQQDETISEATEDEEDEEDEEEGEEDEDPESDVSDSEDEEEEGEDEEDDAEEEASSE
mmetsp:Transcript_14444/g.34100  ORF Transcript_14444/g.34100 Transcript_14444/m.34100 type:complete len:614 (+) Transcript_14444:128-1969(+)|eukprot:CAMPEP_0178405498 /NCGR_PEP_ID=MMETSP0689_2-20121128/18430_1 /TAXON_ID=160604 /ORGANISM="Amphidinium massartii, Strain CS-259" /LENGTH=613 /DNA_ID=CAMNT_0020026515 /DNA_START=130 /DNA_END=1971 /DNA_ORIENTATION=+